MQQSFGGALTLLLSRGRHPGETKMFGAHAGFRPLWPLMLFAPWLTFGLACLVYALRKAPGSASHSTW